MDRLKIAVVGCGRISSAYADALPRLGDLAQLAYAVDTDLKKAQAFAAPFGCAYTDSFSELLDKEIDVVHLCLPHDLHCSMAVQAMEAGIHVLTEKPLGISLQDADEMLRVQQQTGKKLGVIFQTRYNKGIAALRQFIKEGRFGKILSARSILTWNRPYSYYEGSDWKGTWDHEGGGVLIDQAIHSIDRVRYLLDDQVQWIDGSISNHCHRELTKTGRKLQVEDTAEAAVQFRGGCLYSLYACDNYGADSPITIEILGEKGRCGMIQDMGFYELDGCYTEIRSAYEGKKIGPEYWGTTHHLQLKDFYESVLYDRPVAIDGMEGRKTLEIIKGIYLSSMRRDRVYLPFEDVCYTAVGVPLHPCEKSVTNC